MQQEVAQQNRMLSPMQPPPGYAATNGSEPGEAAEELPYD
jgi:hypothetical protein